MALFFLTFQKIYDIIIIENKERKKCGMAIELVKALLLIVRYCTSCENCKECPMAEFCGKTPQDWGN